MATVYGLFLFSVIMVITMPTNVCHPIAKNDLVFGEDFLSIYINQNKLHKEPKSKSISTNLFLPEEKRVEMNETDDPILSSSSIEDEDNMNDMFENLDTSVMKSSTTARNAISEITTKKMLDNVEKIENPSDQQNVVKLVTSGSRIVFLEEIDNSSDTKDIASSTVQSIKINAPPHDTPSEVKIVSVRISSSETKLQNDGNNRKITQSKKEQLEIRNSQQELKDSIQEESLRIQTIVSPPESLQTQSQMSTVETAPIHRVIVHDPNYYREKSARPRAVSYSSLSQTINYSVKSSTHESRLAQNKSTSAMSSSPPFFSEPSKIYSEPAKIYSEASKVYGEPSKIYSEPSKIYSEPAKVYSEPSKFYSEPAKFYSEPSKIYGEPSKFYSLPAGSVEPSATMSTISTSDTTMSPLTDSKKVIFNLDRLPYDFLNAPTEENKNNKNIHTAPNNKFNPVKKPTHLENPLDSDGPKSSSISNQSKTVANIPVDNSDSLFKTSSDINASEMNHELDPKVGYVVESRDYRKYRVEEKTSDGFIVGEYGVVSNNDGSLRGVRYTADSNINPNLIHKALMKFLSL